ncbi:MAG: outer membrane protein [Luteimonas sp.]
MSPIKTSLAAAVLALVAAPAFAQSTDARWAGFYAGGSFGVGDGSDDSDRSVTFDTNRDGRFNDTVRTAAGANAFSPGFCGGQATSARPTTGCRDDKGGAEYGLRGGYDWQTGGLVYGVVVEYTKNDARDRQSAFSTTPAFYTFTRDLDSMIAVRGRIGYAFGESQDFLAYFTAGGVQAKIDHSFTTSNAANSFAANGDDKANGYQAGIGFERLVNDHFSVGLEYLYTEVEDDDYTVRVGRGTAPVTNPFLLVNPAGTDMRRSDEDFAYGALKLTATYRF